MPVRDTLLLVTLVTVLAVSVGVRAEEDALAVATVSSSDQSQSGPILEALLRKSFTKICTAVIDDDDEDALFGQLYAVFRHHKFAANPLKHLNIKTRPVCRNFHGPPPDDKDWLEFCSSLTLHTSFCKCSVLMAIPSAQSLKNSHAVKQLFFRLKALRPAPDRAAFTRQARKAWLPTGQTAASFCKGIDASLSGKSPTPAPKEFQEQQLAWTAILSSKSTSIDHYALADAVNQRVNAAVSALKTQRSFSVVMKTEWEFGGVVMGLGGSVIFSTSEELSLSGSGSFNSETDEESTAMGAMSNFIADRIASRLVPEIRMAMIKLRDAKKAHQRRTWGVAIKVMLSGMSVKAGVEIGSTVGQDHPNRRTRMLTRSHSTMSLSGGGGGGGGTLNP